MPNNMQTSSTLRHPADKALRALVAIPERTNMELGITLSVNGLIVSGYLVSEEDYFLHLMGIVGETQAEQDVKTTLSEFLDQLRLGLRQEEGENLRLPEFVHLRNAKMYPSQGHGMPTQGAALWRGRISSVDGFSLGEIISTSFEGVSMAPHVGS